MKLKNMWKRFWTLDVHNHAGFTLVELIIVIAILAILSTGAIAGYSAYVESANKTADKAMIAEIENVLLMAYYNGDITQAGYVILTADDDANASTAQLVNALEEAYGTNWASALKLKYNWQSNYGDTSFAGKEEALLNKVDDLTINLGDAIKNYNGANFKDFMDQNEISHDDAGGAAVLYIAQATAGLKTQEQKQNFANAISGAQTIDGMYADLLVAFQDQPGGEVAAIAAMYALGEVYCMENNLNVTLNTDGIDDPASAKDAVMTFFGAIASDPNVGAEKLFEYLHNDAAEDAVAYLDVMSTVNGSKNTIINNGLGDFSGLQGMFEAYAAGGVMITVDFQNGDATIGNTLPQE